MGMSAHESAAYYSYLQDVAGGSLFCTGPLLRRFELKSVAIGSAVVAGLAMVWLYFLRAHSRSGSRQARSA